MFAQWLQAYEIDDLAVATVIATFRTAFPSVEIWQTQAGDLLLLGTRTPVRLDRTSLERRLRQEPIRTALAAVWRVDSVEGFYSYRLAGPALADAVQAARPPLNTDNHTVLEFALSRTVGVQHAAFRPERLLKSAVRLGAAEPPAELALDSERLQRARIARPPVLRHPAPSRPTGRSREEEALSAFVELTAAGRWREAGQLWRARGLTPFGPHEHSLAARSLIASGDFDAARHAIAGLRSCLPLEADALDVHLAWASGDPESKAVEQLVTVLERYRTDPLPDPDLLRNTVRLAGTIAEARPAETARIASLLAAPFAARLQENVRMRTALLAALSIPHRSGAAARLRALEQFEPWIPWEGSFLRERVRIYAQAGHPRAMAAAEDLAAWSEQQPVPFDEWLQGIP